MPTPSKNLVQKIAKSGPKPTCECMKCPKCRARLRQRKFYNENSVRLKLGIKQEIDYEE